MSTSKKNLPDTAPRFPFGEWMAGLATGTLCLISALALAYHVYDEITVSHWAVQIAFTVLAGLFAFLMGLVPMSLARAHGTAMEGGNAQTGILFIAALFMAVDGFLLVHAVQYAQELMGMSKTELVWLVPFVMAFEIAAFFVRSQIYAVSKEIQELIDARAHDREMASAFARQKLEREAAELGVQFDGRTGDGALMAKISQKKMHIVR